MTDSTTPAADNDTDLDDATSATLDTLEDVLDAVRERHPNTPQWEFCEGVLTALLCTRRAIGEDEWLPFIFSRDGDVTISVSDTGAGIDPEHIPRLTERFYRVDRSRSRETGGTGLGLAIVKHVLQRHGGVVDIQSRLGHGSTFSLWFPADRVRALPQGQAGLARPS